MSKPVEHCDTLKVSADLSEASLEQAIIEVITLKCNNTDHSSPYLGDYTLSCNLLEFRRAAIMCFDSRESILLLLTPRTNTPDSWSLSWTDYENTIKFTISTDGA